MIFQNILDRQVPIGMQGNLPPVPVSLFNFPLSFAFSGERKGVFHLRCHTIRLICSI